MNSKEIKDQKVQIVGLTNYLKGLPNEKFTLALILIASIIIGSLGYYLLESKLDPVSIVWYGSIMGLVFLGIPAAISGFATSLVTKPMKRKFVLRRSMYLSLIGMLLVGFLYLLGIIMSNGNPRLFFDLMIFGYIMIFAVRILVIMITNPYSLIRSSFVASMHPLLGFITILLSTGITTTSRLLPLPSISATFVVIKIIVGLSILTIGIMALIEIISAPLRRSFGASTFKLAGAFLAHWFDGSLEIEKELKPLSEKVDAYIGIIAFKAKGKIKSLMVIPYLHPGPFGQVGGGKMTRVITQITEQKLNTLTIVPHGTATHDLNPLRTDTIYRFSNEIAEAAKKIEYESTASTAIRTTTGKIKVLSQKFGKSAFLVTTLHPEATEDVDFTIGWALMNKLEKDFKNVIWSDAHNAHKHGHYTVFSGDQLMFDFEKALQRNADELKSQHEGKIKMGCAKDNMIEYSNDNGIGYCGIRAVVIQVNGKKNAYVVFDGNNMETGLRDDIIREIKKLGIDELEVMTSDTHAVNTVQGVDNPVGMRANPEGLIRHAVDVTKKAMENMEDAEVGMKMLRIKDVEVFGAQKATEIITMASTMASMLKITVPIILISSMILSLLGVLLIPW